ncbi:hypothetical protein [Janthinobacterium sp. 17J80-10]|uniref:hypothetical protein n=1 Tax=Janthinobacterium sp. 17J80-10 TaxID=2497863 RepID=UPI0010057B4F|nr:hypothetical protein [Janthinobacterium sp. 17J80-10]QAU35545.1 hypothetical protein EKL02_16000 [Janthinobacterium sp. 17J80-10]
MSAWDSLISKIRSDGHKTPDASRPATTDSDRNDAGTLIAAVEPFLDMDLTAFRAQLVDETTIARQQMLLKEQLGPADSAEFIERLIRAMAEIKADIHYLKAAYVGSTRYQEPEFQIRMPELPGKVVPEVLEIDMRGDITGRNWYHAEPDGRWAGPECDSSLLLPALGAGTYDLSIDIVDEITAGIIDGMQATLNKQPVALTRDGPDLPASLQARVTIPASYRFPFWTLKLEFAKLVSPASMGSDDSRVLAIRVRRIRFAKAAA